MQTNTRTNINRKKLIKKKIKANKRKRIKYFEIRMQNIYSNISKYNTNKCHNNNNINMQT